MRITIQTKFIVLIIIIYQLISCNSRPTETVKQANDSITISENNEGIQSLKSGDKIIPFEKIPPEGIYILNNVENDRHAIEVIYKDNTINFHIGEDKFNLVYDAHATIDENGQISFSDYPTAWYDGNGVIKMAGYYFFGNSSDEDGEFIYQTAVISDSDDLTVGLEWDKANATSIMNHELDRYPNWSDINKHDSIRLNNNFTFLPRFVLNKRELITGLAITTWKGNFCEGCNVVLSLFEFENKNGWRLTNKAINFSQVSVMLGDSVAIYQLGENVYGILVANFIRYNKGETNQDITLYSFLNEKLIPVLKIPHKTNGDDNYRVRIKKSNNTNEQGYYYLLVEQSETLADGKIDIKKTVYSFNGDKYKVFNGYITEPSLTSIERFIDLNSINEKENGICPTCHGTGIIICPLCGGTGVTNMGIECNCVRTYKIELEAGHVTHKPLKWTCLTCGGTGRYNN